MIEENPNIDELLNAFIDGELSQRHEVEVHRLIKHDPQVAGRLQELRNCRLLVSALPFVDAPDATLDKIKASLKTKTILPSQSYSFDGFKGAVHLLTRRAVAAAAMIGLFAVLATVVYTIVTPANVSQKLVSWLPDINFKTVKPASTMPPSAAKPVVVQTGEAAEASIKFAATLELKTSVLNAVDAFIKRSIEDNRMSEYARFEIMEDKCIYTLDCDRKGLNALLADMGNIWSRFDAATLLVETGRLGRQITVDAVNVRQITEIAGQNDSENCLKTARGIAALNSINRLCPGRQLLAAGENKWTELITIPKPVLTSNNKKIKKSAGFTDNKGKVHLTIVVVNTD